MGAAVRKIMPPRRTQLLAVVGEDLRVVCAALDGDVGHAAIEQVFGTPLRIDVDQHPVGGLSLAGMTRDRKSSDRSLAGLSVCLPEFFSFDVRLVGQLGQRKQV
jgi:hypothetical protein